MKNLNPNKRLLENLNGRATEQVPFWFMRQAGRYLPEYRELRKEIGGFLNLVYNPELASEVTMQPIRRFGMDAAILFSDILVIPQALGQNLRFETGEGPRLDALQSEEAIHNLNLNILDETLAPIYQTVSETRSKLTKEGFDHTALIGFAGSPWTLACYMIEGGGSKTFEKTKCWAYGKPEIFQKLIDILVQANIHYLSKQIDAGVEAIQLFDSWASVLNAPNFQRWVIEPTIEIVNGLKKLHPNTPIIGFPRDAGDKSIQYANDTGVNAIGLDFSTSSSWAKDNLQSILPVQGNLDPVTLLQGGEVMEREANNILETFAGSPFIFNLGHGVIKETPPKHVEKLSRIIQDFRA